MTDSVLIESRKKNPVPPVQVGSARVTGPVGETEDTAGPAVPATSLSVKMPDSGAIPDGSNDGAAGLQERQDPGYLEAIEPLKSRVAEMQSEWHNLSGSIEVQREKLESLLDSVPVVIEPSALKALLLRVDYLEQVISQIFDEPQTKIAARGSKKRYIMSLSALGATVILWGVFIGLNLIG